VIYSEGLRPAVHVADFVNALWGRRGACGARHWSAEGATGEARVSAGGARWHSVESQAKRGARDSARSEAIEICDIFRDD
jgi:hypothetical protein